MSFLDSMKKQFRSVIAWENPTADLLFAKFTARGDEIKDLSQLIVAPGQGAVLVYEGKIEAVITEEGKYDVRTDNQPFITTLRKVLQFFESEHKTGIWFFRRADVLNVRWGTVSPIRYLDPTYKFPVALGAFGNFSFRIADPEFFFRQILGGSEGYQVEGARRVLLSRIGQPIADFLATSKFSCIEIDAHRAEIAAVAIERSTPVFADLGFQLLDLRIEGTSFDDDTHTRIARIADMTTENLAAREVGLSFSEMQHLGILRDAARNEGGTASIGVQAAMGAQIAQQLSQQKPAASPESDGQDQLLTKLKRLKVLLDEGVIDEAEYKNKKTSLLEQL